MNYNSQITTTTTTTTTNYYDSRAYKLQLHDARAYNHNYYDQELLQPQLQRPVRADQLQQLHDSRA